MDGAGYEWQFVIILSPDIGHDGPFIFQSTNFSSQEVKFVWKGKTTFNVWWAVDENVFAMISPLIDQQKIKLVNCFDGLIVHKFLKQKCQTCLNSRIC